MILYSMVTKDMDVSIILMNSIIVKKTVITVIAGVVASLLYLELIDDYFSKPYD